MNANGSVYVIMSCGATSPSDPRLHRYLTQVRDTISKQSLAFRKEQHSESYGYGPHLMLVGNPSPRLDGSEHGATYAWFKKHGWPEPEIEGLCASMEFIANSAGIREQLRAVRKQTDADIITVFAPRSTFMETSVHASHLFELAPIIKVDAEGRDIHWDEWWRHVVVDGALAELSWRYPTAHRIASRFVGPTAR